VTWKSILAPAPTFISRHRKSRTHQPCRISHFLLFWSPSPFSLFSPLSPSSLMWCQVPAQRFVPSPFWRSIFRISPRVKPVIQFLDISVQCSDSPPRGLSVENSPRISVLVNPPSLISHHASWIPSEFGVSFFPLFFHSMGVKNEGFFPLIRWPLSPA